MTATRDTTCDLIERPAPPARRWPVGMHQTPHGTAVLDHAGIAHLALDTLLRAGCLIDYAQLTADGIRVRLHRAPPPGALGPAQPSLVDGAPVDDRHIAVSWRGIAVEWPNEVPA